MKLYCKLYFFFTSFVYHNVVYHITDYQHEANSIGAHTKIVQFDPQFISDPSQLNAFQLNIPPYQFFNGAGNPSDVIDISSYPSSGLVPSNATQQQTSNTAAAESNDIAQTMTFVSQGMFKHYSIHTFIQEGYKYG